MSTTTAAATTASPTAHTTTSSWRINMMMVCALTKSTGTWTVKYRKTFESFHGNRKKLRKKELNRTGIPFNIPIPMPIVIAWITLHFQSNTGEIGTEANQTIQRMKMRLIKFKHKLI